MPRKQNINQAYLLPGRAPLSKATQFGDLVFGQGCTGRHSSDGAVDKDIIEQTQFTLERIKPIWEETGTPLDNVLSNTYYLARKEDVSSFNEVYAEFFPSGRPSHTAIIIGVGTDYDLAEVTSTACI